MKCHDVLKLFFLLPFISITGCDDDSNKPDSSILKECKKLTTTEINRKIPDGKLLKLENRITMLDTTDDNGMRLYVYQGTRNKGTRAGIHVHKYGGHTCVINGDITIYMEGKIPRVYSAGSCYYMPSNVYMAASNQGQSDALLIDTFILPKGEPEITICEQGY